MKMGRLERWLVNSPVHTRQAAYNAKRLLDLSGAQPGQRYLEVGCGNGTVAKQMAETFGLAVTGVDIDPEQIGYANANLTAPDRMRFLVQDGADLSFADRSFDLAATFHTTHHIAAWLTALAEMERLLKPGGYLIYYDFIYPAWLVPLGKWLAGSYGFPTAPALDSFARSHRLARIHRARSPLHYEAVWQKAKKNKNPTKLVGF